MALDEDCINRLYNWKFDSALDYLDASQATHAEAVGIKALAEVFGNLGWQGGAMSEIIRLAVHDLIGDSD